MEYQVQHNGKGKSHLINDDFDTLCGCYGGDFSSQEHLIVENYRFYLLNTVFETSEKQPISKDLLLHEFCKKCIKQAEKKDLAKRKLRLSIIHVA